MRLLITGGGGFLGQVLARDLVRRGNLLVHGPGKEQLAKISQVLLVDVNPPKKLLFPELESRASVVTGDISDASFCNSLFEGCHGATSVFHLGAMMSGQGEADFDRCMAVNLFGTLNLLESARNCGHARPKFVLASAGATLGSGAPTDFISKEDVVSDATRATPHTTYGMTKACAELLLSDYSRKGFIDGRGCRLPTVVVRAGEPNGATTSCFSALVRDPLSGVDAHMPIAPDVPHAVTDYQTAVSALVRMHELPQQEVDDVLGFDRTVFVPNVA
eukprot:4828648-Pleurochrysis_carterae.AAC.1